jgi:hypothetical protein
MVYDRDKWWAIMNMVGFHEYREFVDEEILFIYLVS